MKKNIIKVRLLMSVMMIVSVIGITSYQLKAEETPSPEVSAEVVILS